MFELTINGVVYSFNFGMGFMREINKKIARPVDGMPDVKKSVGLQYAVAGIIDNDVEVLVDMLDVANKGNSPRVTKALLDDYIDNSETDIDELFKEVLDFLKSANATKKITNLLLEAVEAEKAKQAK
jgi:hypothetical protein